MKVAQDTAHTNRLGNIRRSIFRFIARRSCKHQRRGGEVVTLCEHTHKGRSFDARLSCDGLETVVINLANWHTTRHGGHSLFCARINKLAHNKTAGQVIKGQFTIMFGPTKQ